MMKRRRYLALTGAVLGTSLAGCNGLTGDQTDEPATSTDRLTSDPTTTERAAVTEEEMGEVISTNNELGFDLFHNVVDDTSGNVALSPFSVSLSLGMLYAGTEGETRAEMRNALGYSVDDETLGRAYEQLRTEMAVRGQSTADEDELAFHFERANAIWGDSGYPFDEPRLRSVGNQYGSNFQTVDFEVPSTAREQIDRWMATETGGRIESSITGNELTSATRLLVSDGAYFRGNWKFPFHDAFTLDAEFSHLDGSTTTAPIMSVGPEPLSAEVDGAQIVDLAYAGGGVSMLLICPPVGEFHRHERSLDLSRVNRYVSALREQRGYILLPRFESASAIGLDEVLTTTNVLGGFNVTDTDLSGFVGSSTSSNDLSVQAIPHRSAVRVDEDGTWARKVDPAPPDAVGSPLESPLPIDFDGTRPFLFVVRDRHSGLILNVGRVVNPLTDG